MYECMYVCMSETTTCLFSENFICESERLCMYACMHARMSEPSNCLSSENLTCRSESGDFVRLCTSVHVYVYIYMCVYIYMNIYIYTHTHMWIRPQRPSIPMQSSQLEQQLLYDSSICIYIHTLYTLHIYIYMHYMCIYMYTHMWVCPQPLSRGPPP